VLSHTYSVTNLYAIQAAGDLRLIGQSGEGAFSAVTIGTRLVLAENSLAVVDPARWVANERVTGNMVNDAHRILADGSLAYVGGNDGLISVLDMSAPMSPVVLGSTDLNGYDVRHMVQSGRTLFVLQESKAGVSAVDVTNPRAPRLIATLTFPLWADYASDLVVQGSLAYVAVRDTSSYSTTAQGLRIIDVTNAAAMQVRGGTLYDDKKYLAVIGSYAYVADGTDIDAVLVTNPASPLTAGQWTHSAEVTSMAALGSYLLVGDTGGVLTVYDTVTPTAPAEIGEINTRGPFQSSGQVGTIRLSGSRALVTDTRALAVIDLSTPRTPTVLLRHPFVNVTRDAAWYGSHLVGVGNGTLETLRSCAP
jgi:hypothetical protein